MSSSTVTSEAKIIAAWPEPDQAAWLQAIAAIDDPFADRSRLAKWAPTTRRQTALAVGRFVRWLTATDRLQAGKCITDAAEPAVLVDYFQDEIRSHSLNSVRVWSFYLVAALEAFAPHQDWKWAWKVHYRIKARANREGTRDKAVVHARVLQKLGPIMMAEASNSEAPADLVLYRDGLIIAMLAGSPMRISNFAMIRIDHHLRKEGVRWTVSLSADETKTRKADIWPVAAAIAPKLVHYLEVVRPHLLGINRTNSPSTDRLWIGISGRPIGDQVLRRMIDRETESRLGVRICPHTFRHCAATTYALERPGQSVNAPALLGQFAAATTEKHYIIQQRQVVQAGYLALLATRGRSIDQVR